MASVVVVGAGIAGLACALRLRRAGHEVEILERGAEAGGRMRSERVREFRLDRGAQFVASGYRNLHALCGVLGLSSRVHTLQGTRDGVWRGGSFHPADPLAPATLLRSELLPASARLRLLRLGAELWRQRRRLDPRRPELAAALDGEDLEAGLRRLVGEEACDWLLGPAFAATFDTDPDTLSLAFGLLMARFVLGGFRLQTFDEGTGLFSRSLAEALPVRTRCEVLSVETETAGAKLRYRTQGRERSVLADAAVVALPGSEVARICPKLTPEERGFFDRLRYVRGMVVHLMLEQPPPGLRYTGVAFPRRAGFDLYGLAVDHHKPGAAPSGAGLLNAALTSAAAERLWDAPDAAVESSVLADLERTPVGRLSPVASAVHRHAPMLPLFGPGQIQRLARFLGRLERSPRLAFAGDYLVGPHAEGAVTSGMRAATEIARSL